MAEAVVHDFVGNNSNYFNDLEVAAEELRGIEAYEPDDIYATPKARLINTHGIGDRYFTINRTVDRPTVNFETQDYRLAISLGCELHFAKKLGYAAGFNVDDERKFSRIGINCHSHARPVHSARTNHFSWICR